MDLFQTLGNSYCNSIWEEKLLLPNHGIKTDASVSKPKSLDAFHKKEKYIISKYVEKLFINKEALLNNMNDVITSIWGAVKADNLKEVYRIIVASDVNIINATYDEVVGASLYHDFSEHEALRGFQDSEKKQCDPAACENIKLCLQGCSLLHLACDSDNPAIVELLLQFGADINWRDLHGRTALHHCISTGNNQLAKFLLRRGARASVRDAGGFSVLERTMELGAITDDELFVLLAESE